MFCSELLAWINWLLGLSNMSLLGILELRKDTGVTIFPTESIVCRCRVLWVHWLHSILLSTASIPLPPFVLLPAPAHVLDVSSLVSEDTTEPHALKPPRDFWYVYTHRQKVPTFEPVLADSSFQVEGQSPQPSPPPYDLDVPIALCKGKRSCTDHPIFYFIFYDHLNLSFRQFVMPVSFISTLRSYEEAILVPA